MKHLRSRAAALSLVSGLALALVTALVITQGTKQPILRPPGGERSPEPQPGVEVGLGLMKPVDTDRAIAADTDRANADGHDALNSDVSAPPQLTKERPRDTDVPVLNTEADYFESKYLHLSLAELRAAKKAVAEQYESETARVTNELHACGVYAKYPYEFDESGARLDPADRLDMPADWKRCVNQLFDSPETQEWHLVNIAKEQYPGFYSLKDEYYWLRANVVN